MAKTYFSSDSHYGHRKIILYSNRPFAEMDADNRVIADRFDATADLDKMNRVMVERWNETVTNDDSVWFLGDFCWPGYESIFHQLNGIKHLIIGNHDSHAVLTLPWASQPQHYQEFRLTGDGSFRPLKSERERPTIVLSHYGFRSWNGMQHGTIMLYGHSHGTLPGYRVKPQEGRASKGGGTLDVGVDNWDFRPMTLDQIKARLATLPEFISETHDIK